jgi:hypothetical protein
VRNRRLHIDDKRKVRMSGTLVELASIRILVRRLAKSA